MHSSQIIHPGQHNQDQNNVKKIINNLVVIGDSLSDRGVFYSGERFGNKLVLALGMFSQSPKRRFTNGLVWADYLAINIMNQFEIDSLANSKLHMNIADLSDELLYAGEHKNKISRYDLNNSKLVRYKNDIFLRSYCEGGLCNHNYSAQYFSKSLFARLLVPYLPDKVAAIERDDAHRSLIEKQRTLVMLWSSTNDIGLVNNVTESNYKNKIRLSLLSIKNNIRKLIDSGYCHFLLFNAPNITLSPRFRTLSDAEIASLKECIISFNMNLVKMIGKLRQCYPDCTLNMFDVNAQFEKLFSKPEAYGLEKKKLFQTYVSSSDYDKTRALQHSPGYLFWDEVHPTTMVHYIIANEVEKTIRLQYILKPPTETVSLELEAPCVSKKLY